MAPRLPLKRLVLASTSLADDLAFVALAYLHAVLATRSDTPGRLIGGIMALEDAGYRRAAGNRFVRTMKDVPATIESEGGPRLAGEYEAAIDVLVPAYRSRARDNVTIGEHLTTTEVRGLAYAFNHPAVRLDLEMARLNGEALRATVSLPDEASTEVLRSLSRRSITADQPGR
jgi:hypothetical protein